MACSKLDSREFFAHSLLSALGLAFQNDSVWNDCPEIKKNKNEINNNTI